MFQKTIKNHQISMGFSTIFLSGLPAPGPGRLGEGPAPGAAAAAPGGAPQRAPGAARGALCKTALHW